MRAAVRVGGLGQNRARVRLEEAEARGPVGRVGELLRARETNQRQELLGRLGGHKALLEDHVEIDELGEGALCPVDAGGVARDRKRRRCQRLPSILPYETGGEVEELQAVGEL